MSNLYKQLISNLDGIAVILCLEKEEVFEDLKSHAEIWLPQLSLYQKHIIEGSLVLGYGHFEAFLGDLIKMIYTRHPEKLPDITDLGVWSVSLATRGRLFQPFHFLGIFDGYMAQEDQRMRSL